MSEKQHPLVEHESALEDAANLPIIKLQNNRPSSHPHASTPHEEQQASVLQPASDQLDSVNWIHDPEVDESLAPTLKKGRPRLSERQTPLVLATSEQEQPSTLSAYPPAPIVQSSDISVIIADDYDFSEIDVDIVEIISYSLFQPNKELSTEEPEVSTIAAAPSLPPVIETEISETPVGAGFIPPLASHMTSVDTAHTEGAINLAPTADSDIDITEEEVPETGSSICDAEACVDVEIAEAGSDVQTHVEDQSALVEQEVLSITSEAPSSIEWDTGDGVEDVSETDIVSIEQEPESPIISSSPPLEESLSTEEPLSEPTDVLDTTNATVEEPLPATSDDTPPPALPEEYVEIERPAGEEEIVDEQPVVVEVALSTVETEPVADEEDSHQIVDDQPVVVEAPLSPKEPGKDNVETSLSVKADTADVLVEAASVEIIPVTPTPKRSTSETQVVVRQRRKYTLSRREIGSLILLALFVINTILVWRDLTATHVYLNALDPNTGKVLTQQDFGGYQDAITLTAPAYESSLVYVGLHSNDPQGTQQIMSLSGSPNSWYVTAQFAASLAHGSLSATSDGHLFAVGANGLHVMTANGHILWSLQGEQPSQGTHHYQPISDSQALYAIASLKQSQVAAYDLQHGTRRWVQTLDDTLDDAPPFLLDENTLYVASDHKLYALNSIDGSLRWEKAYPSRTLLMENEDGTQMLLAAGTQGLTALNPATGALVWSFNGQPDDTFTPAQFYQAAIASTSETNSNVIYTTGIVWQMPQVQEQVWLYAVNAATGTLRWSQQVGTGFVSADAGRTLLPLIDTTHGTVVLQQQLDNNEQRITAFDSNTGTSRWSTLMQDITGSSPTLAQTPDGTLILFTTVANSRKVLFTPSLLRIILIVTFALLFIAVLFSAVNWLQTGFSYLQQRSAQFRHLVYTLQHYALSPFQRFRLLSPLSRTLVILLLLSIFGGVGTLGYTQLNQTQNTLYQVATLNGAIQWQHRMTIPTYTLTTDAAGSIITTSVGDHLHQLEALTHNGTVRWKTFSSQGIFSVPTIASSPGTIVVALRGDAAPTYQFAPADVAYPYAIDHLLVLYVLNSSTGIPLWQHILVYPDEQQHAVILGVDSHYIYVAGTQTPPAPASKGATIQLFAVNRITGTIDWRVFGPTEPNDGPHDDGQLLLKEGQAIWQVAGTLYAIDTVVGQIEWRRQIADDDLSVLVQEDQITEAAGAVLVIRRHDVHALDPGTGNDLWTLPSKGASTPQSVAGVTVVGQTILVYGNGQIEAFDLIDHHSLWRNVQFDAIQHLSVSDDGKTIYMIEVSNLAGSSPALVALDAQTGTTQWTFEPAGQTMFPYTSSDSFLSGNSMLFVTVCFPFGQDSCAHERLYALATETGKPAWTFTGRRISDLHLSQDGKTLLFSVNTSPWADLVAHLR